MNFKPKKYFQILIFIIFIIILGLFLTLVFSLNNKNKTNSHLSNNSNFSSLSKASEYFNSSFQVSGSDSVILNNNRIKIVDLSNDDQSFVSNNFNQPTKIYTTYTSVKDYYNIIKPYSIDLLENQEEVFKLTYNTPIVSPKESFLEDINVLSDEEFINYTPNYLVLYKNNQWQVVDPAVVFLKDYKYKNKIFRILVVRKSLLFEDEDIPIELESLYISDENFQNLKEIKEFQKIYIEELKYQKDGIFILVEKLFSSETNQINYVEQEINISEKIQELFID